MCVARVYSNCFEKVKDKDFKSCRGLSYVAPRVLDFCVDTEERVQSIPLQLMSMDVVRSLLSGPPIAEKPHHKLNTWSKGS